MGSSQQCLVWGLFYEMLVANARRTSALMILIGNACRIDEGRHLLLIGNLGRDQKKPERAPPH